MTNSVNHCTQTRKKRPSPVSVRLNETERTELHRRAGNLPLSTFIKKVLFDENSSSSRAVPRHVTVDQAQIAKLLAWLGRTELATHLAVLAEASKADSLIITPPVAAQIGKACADIAAMREALMQAMGKQPDSSAGAIEPVPTQAPDASKPRITAAYLDALMAAHKAASNEGEQPQSQCPSKPRVTAAQFKAWTEANKSGSQQALNDIARYLRDEP